MNLTNAVMHEKLNCRVAHPIEILYEVIGENVSEDKTQKN